MINIGQFSSRTRTVHILCCMFGEITGLGLLKLCFMFYFFFTFLNDHHLIRKFKLLVLLSYIWLKSIELKLDFIIHMLKPGFISFRRQQVA